jgi:uncharacterized protein YcfL
MKIIIITAVVSFLIFGCSKDNHNLQPNASGQPKVMYSFCQSNPRDTLLRTEYTYSNGNLITEARFNKEELISKTTFEYDSEKKPILEVSESSTMKSIKQFIYNEKNQLINIKYHHINYDSNGNVESESKSEAPREYKNNVLVKEWTDWGGFSTYEYRSGKVYTKTNYTKLGTKHHITTYSYSPNFLVREKKETVHGSLLYSKTYLYDNRNRLVKVQDREKIIEENKYTGNRLTEKKIYYFGIDPGYYFCNGNYIYTYTY